MRSKPPHQAGAGSVVNRAELLPPIWIGGRLRPAKVGWVKRDQVPQARSGACKLRRGGLGGGPLPNGRARSLAKQVQVGSASSQGLARSVGAADVTGEGAETRLKDKPSPKAEGPAGCAPRRPCPASSASPATADDLKRPSFAVGNQGSGSPGALGVEHRAPVPEPAASPSCFHSEKAHRASLAPPPSPCPCRRRTSRAASKSPACLSRRASWIERAGLGSAVSASSWNPIAVEQPVDQFLEAAPGTRRLRVHRPIAS